MRGISITGGALKGRTIETPKSGLSRYTSSKVREAIFNILGNVENLTVLDLFSGSGSLAIEALSRGALASTCVETNRSVFNVLKTNIDKLSLSEKSLLLHMDVKDAIPFLGKKQLVYDIIFLDPPYERGYIAETMCLLVTNRIYHPDTMLIFEHSKREVITINNDIFREVVSRRYGDTVVTFFTIQN